MKNFYDTKILVGPGAYLVPRKKSFLGVFCTYSPVSDFSRQNNLCVRSSVENLNHIIPAKHFVLHSL